MRCITIKNLAIQFDADRATSGTPVQQANLAIEIINQALQNALNLDAQILTLKTITQDDLEDEKCPNDFE